MNLRSPYGKDLRDVFLVPADDAFLASANQEEYMLVVLLMHLLGKPMDPSIKFGMNGYLQSLFPDAEGAVNKLEARGYLRPATEKEVLQGMLAPKLKLILAEAGLPKSGNKATLIDRLLASEEKPHREAITPADVPICASGLGMSRVRALYVEREGFERKALDAIMARNYDEAAHLYAQYKARSIQSDEVRNILPLPEQTRIRLAQIDMDHDAACEVLSHIVGGRILHQFNERMEIRYQLIAGAVERDLADLKYARISKYRLRIAKDDQTCDTCRAHMDKTYSVEEAVIGVNCPPFHEGCRCTIFGL